MPVLNTELVDRVNRHIDERHEAFVALGKRFVDQCGSDRGKTQMHNLQQIACSATRFADIEDFVKNQIGKGNQMWKTVGPKVLDQLSELRTWSDLIDDDPANRMAVRLRLARSWARAVVSEYRYGIAVKEMSP